MTTGSTGGVCGVTEPNQQRITKDIAIKHEVACLWLFMLLLYTGLLHVACHLPQ